MIMKSTAWIGEACGALPTLGIVLVYGSRKEHVLRCPMTHSCTIYIIERNGRKNATGSRDATIRAYVPM